MSRTWSSTRRSTISLYACVHLLRAFSPYVVAS